MCESGSARNMINALCLIIISCSILSCCTVEARCTTNTSCSGHGLCFSGSCLCRSPWGGPACETQVLFDEVAKEDSLKTLAAAVPDGQSEQVAPKIQSSTQSKSIAMVTNVSRPIENSVVLQPSQNLAAENMRLQAEVKDLNQGFHRLTSEINSMSATISHHKHDGKAGDASLVHGAESPPEHVKTEIDWEVNHSRMAAIQVMLILATIVIVLFLVYMSEIARDSMDALIGGDEPWEVSIDRPEPNIYRAIGALRPSDVGTLKYTSFLVQAILCIIMQLYIPVTLLYENFVTWQITGVKDYSSGGVAWWFAMILRVVGLFNLVRLFALQTVTEIMDEYKDDWILLSIRRVRTTDKKKNAVLIQFVQSLSHDNPSYRIAAAIMLRKACTPGLPDLTSSDPEKVESVNVIDALCARLASENDDDEDGNVFKKSVETDVLARCEICRALAVLAGPSDAKAQQALRDVLDDESGALETSQEVKDAVTAALEEIQKNDDATPDEELSAAWRAWLVMWVSISLLVTIVCAVFLEVVVFIKIMVLSGSVEEVALIIMAVFFINDLDEKVMKGAPVMKKMYWITVRQQTQMRKFQPMWVKHVAANGGVPLVHLILYVGLGLMVTIAWKNRYTGAVVG